MKKMLLFQVGTMQYGIGLPLVKDIKSAKPIVVEGTGSDIRFTRVLDGKETPLYDLVAIFGERTVSHGYENEKLIMVELQGHPMGMIVSGVNQVVSIPSDRIKPLSPIFKGPSLSCFSKVLKHEGSLILLLTPQGIVKVVGETSDVLNFIDMPDSGYAAHTMEKNITLINDVSTISDHGPMSLVERWTSEPDSYESFQTAADTEFTPPAEDEEIVDRITELFDITGVDDESQCGSASFLANLLQNDRETSPQTETPNHSLIKTSKTDSR